MGVFFTLGFLNSFKRYPIIVLRSPDFPQKRIFFVITSIKCLKYYIYFSKRTKNKNSSGDLGGCQDSFTFFKVKLQVEPGALGLLLLLRWGASFQDQLVLSYCIVLEWQAEGLGKVTLITRCREFLPTT